MGTPVGRILLIPKGDYDPNEIYNNLDWVRHSGAAWVCKVDNTIGIAPRTGVPEWQLMAEDGTVGGWTSITHKPFETIGDGLKTNSSNELIPDVGETIEVNSLTKKLEVVAKNLYVPTGTSSDRPISGQGVKDAIDKTNIGDLKDVQTSTPKDGQVMTWNAATGKYENKDLDKSITRLAGSIDYADLMAGTGATGGTYLSAEYVDKIFILNTGSGSAGISSSDISKWKSNYSVGDEIPIDSHIAVIEFPAGSGVYVFDDFGGYVDISGKLDKTTFEALNRREIRDITSIVRADNGASLLAAIAEQNLAKYGFSIGDYFESPTARTLVSQTYSSGTVTTQTVQVKLKYYLADLDTWYGGYASYEVVGTHHVTLLVDAGITRQWHSASDITNVGYNLCALYNYLKGDILTAIKADMKAIFGGSTGLEHLISHQLYMTKSFTACEWTETYIHTPSEVEIYGSNIFSGNDYQKYAYNKKLAIFDKYRFNQIFGNIPIWLQNMYSASGACRANHSGLAGTSSPVDTHRAAGLILLH